MLVKDSIADQQIYVFCLIETWLQQGVEYVRLNESAPWVRVIVTIQVEAIWHLSILISPRCKLGNNFFENVTQLFQTQNGKICCFYWWDPYSQYLSERNIWWHTDMSSKIQRPYFSIFIFKIQAIWQLRISETLGVSKLTYWKSLRLIKNAAAGVLTERQHISPILAFNQK